MTVYKSVPIVRRLNTEGGSAAQKLPAEESLRRSRAHELLSQKSPSSQLGTTPAEGTLSFESLKKLEIELNTRKVVPRPEGCLPLWFLAETERNVSLWRRGLSLIDSENYQFSICVPALIQKRLEQLKRWEPDNVFLYSLWGTPHTSQESVAAEEAYLEKLARSLQEVVVHVEALEEAIRGATCKASTSKTNTLTPEPDYIEQIVVPE